MTSTPLSKRERRVRRHNFASLLAFLAYLAFMAAKYFPASFLGDISPLLALALLATIIVMFRTRNADEYTAALWRVGTSMAFVITVAFLLMVPFAEGFVDGFMEAHTGEARGQDLPTSTHALPITLGSFFLANAWARLRGTV